jgi:hypothetical protein
MQTIAAPFPAACASVAKCLFPGCLSLTLWVVSSGCTRYEFDIVQPPQFAQLVGTDNDALLQLGPLSYRLRAVEGHLVVRIYNPTAQPIDFLGAESYAVDPQGQSHSLTGQVIAPESFIKLILPPMPPDRPANGPIISFAFGSGGDADAQQPVLDRPAALASPQTWDWTGQTDIRLSLRFQRGTDPPFTHAFLIHRRKM